MTTNAENYQEILNRIRAETVGKLAADVDRSLSLSIPQESGGWRPEAPRWRQVHRNSTFVWPTKSRFGPMRPRGSTRRLAAQWDPQTAVPWDAEFHIPDEVEDAVVQVMTFLIENETAALIIPRRFIAQMHSHFREVMQVLAVQAADEARHIEIFGRRALLKRYCLGLSAVGGQASLKTLVDEPDFAIASFLLSVLGEGSFLSLIWFIKQYAPDPVTEAVARLAAQDEARHVAFGLAHLRQHANRDPSIRARLAAAVYRRHDALRHTAGLNAEVFDALILMAAGSWNHADLRQGYRRVMDLTRDMDEGRKSRLLRLGFSEQEAVELSSLHTRNFM